MVHLRRGLYLSLEGFEDDQDQTIVYIPAQSPSNLTMRVHPYRRDHDFAAAMLTRYFVVAEEMAVLPSLLN